MRNQVVTLRRNIVSGYISQIYISLIGVFLLPLYMKYMGKEAFGLVAFFNMLQVWFGLLDVGMTPTIARETARFKGGALSLFNYRQLLRAMEGVFLLLVLVGVAVLYFISGWIASRWLQFDSLSTAEVSTAIQFMGISVGLRFMCGFYRGVISGMERLELLASFNSTIATARFVGVLPVLMLISATPNAFFSFQLAIALVELILIMILAYRMLPAMPSNQPINWKLAPLKPVFKFSLTIAFTSSVWVLATQTDKLILSKILPLSDYGGFMLAVIVASSVMMLMGPISSAIMPRMVRYEAEGNPRGLIHLYRESTQLVAVMAGSVAVTLAFCAEALLWVWTGDSILARKSALILTLYALGNGVLSVAAFPYYLQYAKGNLRMHLIGNVIFVSLLIPITIWAAVNFGGAGAGYVWLAMNLAVFFFWLPFIHHKFEPGLNAKWYFQDILPVFFVMLLAGYFPAQVISLTGNKTLQLALITLQAIIILTSGILVSSACRNKVLYILKMIVDLKR
jgi:O-antigen/teichoic acid export membrane protein